MAVPPPQWTYPLGASMAPLKYIWIDAAAGRCSWSDAYTRLYSGVCCGVGHASCAEYANSARCHCVLVRLSVG